MNALEHLTPEEQHALEELRSSLNDLLGPDRFRMILFGSKARGDDDEESDLDVAVIVNNLDRTIKRQVIDVVVRIEFKHDVVIGSWVVSSEEFEKLRSRERRIALDIEREGITL